jgi:dCTP deaminase
MSVPVSILCDSTIVRLALDGQIKIEPFDSSLVQPASIDVRLGSHFRIFDTHTIEVIDLKSKQRKITREVTIRDDEAFIIHPGEFCLGTTVERVELPRNIVARVEGKSSLGRLGLIVHATAGFIDPGFRGPITLELSNLMRVPIMLYPGMLVAQLSFMTLDQPAMFPYGSPELNSHYQDQEGATESRYEVTG